MYPEGKRARRTAFALYDIALQLTLQERFFYTMAFQGQVGGGSVMEAFTVGNEMKLGRVSVVAVADFASLSRASLPGTPM